MCQITKRRLLQLLEQKRPTAMHLKRSWKLPMRWCREASRPVPRRAFRRRSQTRREVEYNRSKRAGATLRAPGNMRLRHRKTARRPPVSSMSQDAALFGRTRQKASTRQRKPRGRSNARRSHNTSVRFKSASRDTRTRSQLFCSRSPREECGCATARSCTFEVRACVQAAVFSAVKRLGI